VLDEPLLRLYDDWQEEVIALKTWVVVDDDQIGISGEEERGFC
jgi:hypothetical protein